MLQYLYRDNIFPPTRQVYPIDTLHVPTHMLSGTLWNSIENIAS
jgi:hypothetical protein